MKMFEQKYLIMETIGRNSKKMTSIVRDKQNNYFIAKKVPLDDPANANQIELLKVLKHPNIITLHELIFDKKSVYVIEQYCQQGDLEFHLRRHLRNKKNLSQQIIARWLLQILLALQYLHHIKIIHRDIRPRNIFLTSTGNIKLGSFKVSKLLEQQANYAHTLINSPYYMTPELMNSQAYDSKVDMWAFGCVIYQMCSLKSPLSLASVGDILGKMSKIQDLPSIYSSELNKLYHQCMRKSPAARISARELLKTTYFIDAMQLFIRDKCVNICLNIPIKRYKIHKSKIDKQKSKPPVFKSKKQPMLPKLDSIAIRPSSRQKSNSKQKSSYLIPNPNFKPSSKSKDKYSKAFSTQKKREKSVTDKRSSNKIDLYGQLAMGKTGSKKKQESQGVSKQLMRAPPLLPRPNKQVIDVPSPERRTKTKASEPQQKNSFQMTMSKEQLQKQLGIFVSKSKDLSQVKQGLDKVFETLNFLQMGQQEQIQFNFEEENQLRLTNKSTSDDTASLMVTCQKKLQQFIEQLNLKYSPNMQAIPERTTQFDSSIFSKLSKPSLSNGL